MATTTDQLTVRVVVDSKGAEVGFKDLQDQLRDLKGQLLKSSSDFKVVEKSFSSLGEEAKKAFTKVQQSAQQTQVPLEKTSDAAKNLGETTQKAGEQSQSAGKKLEGFGLEALKLNAILDIAQKIFGAYQSAVDATVGLYAQAESAQIRLTQAIAGAGDRVRNSAESWTEYLQAIERATGADADNLAGVVARTLNLGFNEKQTRGLIEASLKLAKIQGTDVDESIQTLINSYRGVARELKVVLPEINRLGPEQEKNFLQAGGAVDLINKKYADISVGAKGYSGAVKIQQKAFEDLKKEIGGSLVQFFELEEKTRTLTDLAISLKEALSGIDWRGLRDGLIAFSSVAAGVVTIILAMSGALPALIALLSSLAVKAALAALPFLKFAGIALLVVGVASAIDILIRNIGLLGDIVELVKSLFLQLIAVIQEKLLVAVKSVFEVFGLDDRVARANTLIQKVQQKFIDLGVKGKEAGTRIKDGFDFGFLGQVTKTISQAIEKFNKPIPKGLGQQKFDDSKEGGRTAEYDQAAIAEKIKGIRASIFEIQQRTLGLGDNLYAQNLRDYELGKNKLEDQLKELQKIGGTQKQINDLRRQGIDALDKQKGKGFEIINKADVEANKKLQLDIANYGKGARAAAIENAKFENEAIDRKIKEAQAAGQVTDELEKRKKLNLEKAGQTAMSAADAAGIGGLSSQVSEIFAGPVGAFTSAAEGIVSGVQKLIDFIPNILDGVANIFKTLTELPMRILASLKNLVDQLVKYITDYIQNLVSAIPDILITILDALAQKIPDALVKLADAIPVVIEGFIKRIPEIVSKLVSHMISSLPIIAIRLTGSLIRSLPMLIAQMPKIAIALVKGIVDGLKSAIFGIGDALAGLFGDSLSAGVANALPALQSFTTGVSDQLFKVGEFSAGQKVADAADRANAIVSDLEKKVSGLAQRIWQGILEAIQKTWGYLVTLGTAIWDALVNAAKATWDFLKSIGTTIWNGLKEGFTKGMDFFTEAGSAIWEALKKGLTDAGSGLLAILNKLNPINLISKLFDFSPSQGRVESWLGIDIPMVRFAEGGKVPGYAPVAGDSLKNDKVPALLSAGEVVLPRSIVNNSAYQKVIEAMFRGEPVAQFAIGGALKKAGSVIASGASAVVNTVVGTLSGLSEDARAVWDFLKSFGASLDLGAFIANPAREAMSAFRSVADKVFFNDGVKGLFENYFMAKRFAEGGFVSGYGNQDTVPALVSPGEYVVSRQGVSAVGLNALNAINSGQNIASGGTTNITLNLTLNTTKPIDSSFVRDNLMPTIKEELRKESRRGGYIIAAGGVRS